MEVLVTILAVSIRVGRSTEIAPCVKIAHDIRKAAEGGTRYEIEMSFTFPVRGRSITIPASTPVSKTHFESRIDEKWDDVHTDPVTAPSAPDPGASITCTAKITLDGKDVSLESTSVVPGLPAGAAPPHHR